MKSMRLLYNDKHDDYWRNEISVNKGNTQGPVSYTHLTLPTIYSV